MKIAHCADVHIGPTTYGRLDPETGRSTRIGDQCRMLDFVVAAAIAAHVDLFVFAGDAFHNSRASSTHQYLFAECLMPLIVREIPIVIIPGNHDAPGSFGKNSGLDILGLLGENTYVYTDPTFATISTRSGPVNIIALPWPLRSRLLTKDENQTLTPQEVVKRMEVQYADFITQSLKAARATDCANVLVGHFSIEGALPGGSEASVSVSKEPVFSVKSLAQPGLDIGLFGHIHKHQNMNPDPDGVPLLYSSSTSRRTFNEMDSDRGFVIVDIKDRRQEIISSDEPRVTWEFIPTPARTYIAIDVDVREGDRHPQAPEKEFKKDDYAVPLSNDPTVLASRVTYVADGEMRLLGDGGGPAVRMSEYRQATPYEEKWMRCMGLNVSEREKALGDLSIVSWRSIIGKGVDVREGDRHPQAMIISAISHATEEPGRNGAVVRVRYQANPEQLAEIDEKEIAAFITPWASCIAEITYIHEPEERVRRSEVTIDTSVGDAITGWAKQHDAYDDIADELVTAGLDIQRFVDAGSPEEG